MNAENPLIGRMQGRIRFLRDVGRVKDPELLEDSLLVITELVAATSALLDDMGAPDDGIVANLMAACRSAIAKATGEAA